MSYRNDSIGIKMYMRFH